MKRIDSREGAKRQHRAVALFAALQCWIKRLDGIVLDRPDLERLSGLERFRGGRVASIKADFKEFFPFQEVYYTKKQSSFGSLYLSRRDFKGAVPPGWMSDQRPYCTNPEPRASLSHVSDVAPCDSVAG